MKRSFSIIALLVAMVFVLTACGGPAVPTHTDRWANGETASFVISLADETNVKDFAEEVPTYNKVPGAQVKPTDVTGTLELETSYNDNIWHFEVKMQVEETYTTGQLPSDWKATLDDAQIPYTQNGNNVVITTKMESMANFGTVYNKKLPVYSAKGVTGVVVYYNEDTQPALSVNDFVSEVSYSDDKANVKFNDKTGTVTSKPATATVDTEDFFFDNEMLILAVRSIDMEMLAEASTTTFESFNSVEQQMQTITVALSSDEYKLDESKDDLTYRVGVSVEGVSAYSYFMYFEQIKTIPHPGGGIGKPIMQQQLVEMNSGYMHFERV